MQLFLKPQIQIEKLAANGQANAEAIADDGDIHDFFPVVKLFTPDGAATWLLSEIDPDEPDTAFGLCDLGVDCPELGTVRLSELESVCGRLGMPIERDLLHFKAKHRLTSGEHSNFALFYCFIGGEPAAAIVAIVPPACEGDDYQIAPFFVSVTDNIVPTDHAGVPLGGAS